LLSQWRSYTPHGKGVSLELSSDKVNELLLSSEVKLIKCVYEYEEQRKIIGGLIDEILNRFNNRIDNASYHDYIKTFYDEIYFILASIKHDAFKEEREWRLVSKLSGSFKSTELKFREGSSMISPYIEIPLLSKSYFESVRLGPSQHQNLSFSSLSMFTTNNELCRCVINSQVPYREW